MTQKKTAKLEKRIVRGSRSVKIYNIRNFYIAIYTRHSCGQSRLANKHMKYKDDPLAKLIHNDRQLFSTHVLAAHLRMKIVQGKVDRLVLSRLVWPSAGRGRVRAYPVLYRPSKPTYEVCSAPSRRLDRSDSGHLNNSFNPPSFASDAYR